MCTYVSMYMKCMNVTLGVCMYVCTHTLFWQHSVSSTLVLCHERCVTPNASYVSA